LTFQVAIRIRLHGTGARVPGQAARLRGGSTIR
jgi:hypothetical protein